MYKYMPAPMHRKQMPEKSEKNFSPAANFCETASSLQWYCRWCGCFWRWWWWSSAVVLIPNLWININVVLIVGAQHHRACIRGATILTETKCLTHKYSVSSFFPFSLLSHFFACELRLYLYFQLGYLPLTTILLFFVPFFVVVAVNASRF